MLSRLRVTLAQRTSGTAALRCHVRWNPSRDFLYFFILVERHVLDAWEHLARCFVAPPHVQRYSTTTFLSAACTITQIVIFTKYLFSFRRQCSLPSPMCL